MITQARLKELLHYDPETGIFTNLITRNNRAAAGCVSGSTSYYGYIVISIDGKGYRAHRLAFLYMTDHIPPDDVDHINGVKDDNRFNNLRSCSRRQNIQNKRVQSNSKSGVKGVYWCKSARKWVTQIKNNGRIETAGSFDSIEEASIAIRAARERLHGEFAHH